MLWFVVLSTMSVATGRFRLRCEKERKGKKDVRCRGLLGATRSDHFCRIFSLVILCCFAWFPKMMRRPSYRQLLRFEYAFPARANFLYFFLIV